MFAIYKKEMRSYFTNPLGYVYLGVFLVLSSLICCYTTLQTKTYSTTAYFNILLFALIVLIPILTMRTFAEEKKMRTEQLPLTAPVTITGMVFGKYLAAMTMFVGSLLLSCVNLIPLYILSYEETAATRAEINQAASDFMQTTVTGGASEYFIGPNTPQIIGSLVGLILLGAAFVAIGVFVSSLTENQLSSSVITMGIIVFLLIIGFVNNIGSDAAGNRLISNYTVRAVIDWISVYSRFIRFGYGIFDIASLLYFISLAAIFLFLTIRIYEKRRWE